MAILDVKKRLQERFKPTYEGWKLSRTDAEVPKDIGVLSLPTRDGNRRTRGTPWASRFGFEPTYEGWKFIFKVLT